MIIHESPREIPPAAAVERLASRDGWAAAAVGMTWGALFFYCFFMGDSARRGAAVLSRVVFFREDALLRISA